MPTLARVLAVGVAACMVNPHHVRVWQPPIEVVGASAAAADVQFTRGVLLAPLDPDYTKFAGLGRNANGFAYAVLLLGGGAALGAALGFAIGGVRPAHLALWVGFALLSLRTVAAIPFFAVVTVPLAAGAVNAVSARIKLGSRGHVGTRLALLGSGVGRVLTLLALVAVAVLAWPGWLHPDPGAASDARRVAWAVEADPGMVHAAKQFEAWREAGRLPDDAHGVILSIPLADYCAFHAPREKVYLNSHLTHHRPELADYVGLRVALGLLRRPGADDVPDLPAAAKLLEKHTAEYVTLSGRRAQADHKEAVVRLLNQPDRWTPWYLDGRADVFARRLAAAPPRPHVDAIGRAFGPGVEKLPPGRPVPPPADGGPFAPFVRSPLPAPAAADEAVRWLEYKQVMKQSLTSKTFHAQALLLRLGRVPGGPFAAADFQLTIEARDRPLIARTLFAPWPEPGVPEAATVLALRAARRAIAANPDHPDGYNALAFALADEDLPVPEADRLLGRIAALRQCLLRFPPADQYKPGEFAASPTRVAWQLASLYYEQDPPPQDRTRGVADRLGLVHPELAGALERWLVNVVVPGPGGRPQLVRVQFSLARPVDLAHDALSRAAKYAAVEFADTEPERRPRYVADLPKQLKSLDDGVRTRADRVNQLSRDRQSAKERYFAARQADLVGEAIQVLKTADLAKEFGAEAPVYALQRIALQVRAGMIEDAAHDIADLGKVFDESARRPDADPNQVGRLRYVLRELEYLTLVIVGDYAAAGADLESRAQQSFAQNGPILPPAEFLAAVAGSPGAVPPGVSALVGGTAAVGPAYIFARGQVVARLQDEATYYYRRGFLALLEGDIPAARERFRQSTRKPPLGWNVPTLANANALEYLRLIEAAEKR